MADPFDPDTRRSIKMAMAGDAYDRDFVRIVEPDVSAYSWLVASQRAVFAVAEDRVSLVIHGWFFGVCHHGDRFYLFENCGLRDRTSNMGRVIRVDLVNGMLVNPTILVKGLHTNCHQIRVINNILCVVDTVNQAILRYSLEGGLIDVKHPFPVAPHTDRTGAYLHLNAIAMVGSRIAIMCHNGNTVPEKNSEIAFLDADWKMSMMHPLDGHWCHDIVEDDDGMLWYCDSKAGAIVRSDGHRLEISNDMLTRGLAVSPTRIVVGISSFGPRQMRDTLGGRIVIFDRQFNRVSELELEGPPTDIADLRVRQHARERSLRP